MMVRKWPVVGVLLAVLWVFVRGVALSPMPLLGEFLIGLAVGLPVALVSRRLYLPAVNLGRTLRALPMATLYVAVFGWELLTANVDVAYRLLHPRLPIEPDVIELPLRVQGDAAVTTIANSITLTPGTLTMDHDPDTNTLYVHGIIGQRREATVAPIRRFEDILLVVFDEPADPGDAPPAPVHQDRHCPERAERAAVGGTATDVAAESDAAGDREGAGDDATDGGETDGS